MYNIQTLNKIAACGTDVFNKANYNISDTVEKPDAIMVRSAAMHDMVFASNLLAIARAGAGVNNIPVERCAQEGICVFNTPGANSNAVKELAICALLLASRKIVEAAEWLSPSRVHLMLQRLLKAASPSSQVLRLQARHSVSSVSVLSAVRSLTLLSLSA